jgi:uncharacterized membrane-anchored protein YjiN (DUF445 family)
MIKKENFKAKDGKTLTRTYSDTEHKIRNKATNVIYGEAVDVADDVEYEEIDEYLEVKAMTYEEITQIVDTIQETSKKINRIDLTDNEALSVKDFYPTWESKIGDNVEQGYKMLYNDNLWRVRQNHMVLEVYPPSLSTAALYEVINYQHEGTLEDPIPYNPPMEIFNGKYYIQNDIKYLCNRDSGTALSHDLSALVGLYVELV